MSDVASARGGACAPAWIQVRARGPHPTAQSPRAPRRESSAPWPCAHAVDKRGLYYGLFCWEEITTCVALKVIRR
jgi:hypothetical protein